MKVQFCGLILLFAIFVVTEGKTFTRCELAKTLLRNGIPRNQLNDWVCLTAAESGYRTDAINKKNKNGSWDYGIFQFNSMYWCKGGPHNKSNDCNVDCSALLTDDITNSIKCGKLVYKRHGFSAWYGWQNKCKGKDISKYTAGCQL